MSSGYDSSEDENIRLEHGLSATIDRITRLQRRSKRVVSTLQSIKISLDSAIERCLSDIRVQVDYEDTRYVGDVIHSVKLSTWIETIHWESTIKTMQAAWTVRGLHPVASACLEASQSIARAITALKRLQHTTTALNDQLDVRYRYSSLSKVETQLLDVVGSVGAKHIHGAKDALADFLRAYNKLEDCVPRRVMSNFTEAGRQERRAIMAECWDEAFAPTRDNMDASTFRNRAAAILALIQSVWSGILGEIQSDIEEVGYTIRKDILGQR